MNSLGDKLAHGAGLIGVEVSDARDAVGERHPAEVAQVVEARSNVMGRRSGVPGGQHRVPTSPPSSVSVGDKADEMETLITSPEPSRTAGAGRKATAAPRLAAASPAAVGPVPVRCGDYTKSN